MQLRLARIIVKEPKYVEALKVIAESDAEEAEAKAEVEAADETAKESVEDPKEPDESQSE